LPVSLIPADGTWPVGIAAYEKRNLALELPEWDMTLCTQCGQCPMVCPHAAIRRKVLPSEATVGVPLTFKHLPVRGKDFPAGWHIGYQVAPDDCTGCGLCVEVCPIRDKQDPTHKALDGPSLIIAYSPCIAHGVDLSHNLRQQDLAVDAGHWALYRYDPRKAAAGENPLHLDAKRPSIPLHDFMSTETRFSVLERIHPEAAERFLRQAQREAESTFLLYEQLAQLAVRN
jgi:ferredoxin